mmetsp:Transcript_35395/g.86179  ORF Transcript_35395/g.86179 Transcript_35395/m.86179 type:complete len:212 (-) Transcript_35395:749-1384(-)
MFLRVARGLLGAVNVSLLESRNVRAFCTCVAPTGHSVAGAPGEQRKRLSPNCSTRYSVLTKFSPNTSTVSPPVVYPPTGETAVMRIGWWKRNCCSEYPNCCPFHVRATVASPHVGQAVVGVLRMAEEEEEETEEEEEELWEEDEEEEVEHCCDDAEHPPYNDGRDDGSLFDGKHDEEHSACADVGGREGAHSRLLLCRGRLALCAVPRPEV